MPKKSATRVKLSIHDIAERLGVHEQTAQMMLDTGIIDATCSQGVTICIEEAFNDYLASLQPVTYEKMRESTDRALSSYRTTLHALYEWDLLLTELQATAAPTDKQFIQQFQQHMHHLIDRTTRTYQQGMQMVEEARQKYLK